MLIKKNKQKIIQCMKLIPQPVKERSSIHATHLEKLYKGLLTQTTAPHNHLPTLLNDISLHYFLSITIICQHLILMGNVIH